MTKTVPPTTQIVLHGAPNDGANDELPPPAVSPTPSHHSQHRRGALILFQSRWKSFKDAVKKGTGYSTKPMEWSSSLLNLSDHENSADDDPDAILDDEELTWLSGQNGEDPLALILVDREPSTASQASPHFTSSHENVPGQFGLNPANKPDVPNDQTYRLKTYEPSVQDSQHGAISPITWIRYRAFPWLKRAVLRYLYPVFSDPVVEARYSERVYNSQKVLPRIPWASKFLAYQNLAASITIKQEHLFEWDTLRIKLISMSKLLNDVLDQKRMDAGKFEIVSRPFAFHQVVRQTIFGCRMAMDQKQQEMILDLDQNIDIAARTASYQAKGKSEDETYRAMAAIPAEDGIVGGDETRLTQVLTNLVNNATKFTPDHGKIRIKTQLLSPVPLRPVVGPSSSRMRTHSRLLSAPTDARSQSSSGTLMNGPGKWDDDTNRLVVRIEVSDTGCGISSSDVKDRALFSPYAQAGIGRLQGGSGTGLGVSLVRRIVKLMGGRMGVESLPGAGTTFWVEFPLRFTTGKESQRDPLPPPLMSSPMPSYSTEGTKTRVGSAGGSLTAAPSMSPQSTQQTQDPLTMPAAEAVPAASKPKVGADLSVLVVDDDMALRGLLQRLLQRLGCRVETAENGKLALQKLGVDLQRRNEPSISSSRLLLSDDPEA
ncbi:hypothetical protein FRC17_009615, partial [Serendipita sp. 399]